MLKAKTGRRENEMDVKGFLATLKKIGFVHSETWARYTLRQHPILGRIEPINGSESSHYYFNKEQVKEYIMYRDHTHPLYHSFKKLVKETNLKMEPINIWRNKFTYIVVNKLAIHPVKRYGQLYVTRRQAEKIKQFITGRDL